MTEPLKRYGGFLHPTHACYDGKTEYCKAEDVAVLEALMQELVDKSLARVRELEAHQRCTCGASRCLHERGCPALAKARHD